MDNPELVPSSPSTFNRQANVTAQDRLPTSTSAERCTPPIERQSDPSRMDVIRKHLTDRGFSSGATDLIISSWSSGTDKQYNSAWKRWCSWCKQREVDIIQAPIEQVGNFLSDCYDEGKGYSTLNSYRSALSSTLSPVNNCAVGSHPLITRLLKGIYSLRTPVPRYATTWDVTMVTNYLKTFFPLDQLTLKQLTLKTVMLCALSSSQREQTLCALDLNYKVESPACISFVIPEKLKTSKPGKSVKVKFECLRDKPELCTKCTLAEYISRTQDVRNLCGTIASKLFVSYIKPHKPVSTDTLARWLKLVMTDAGIDTSVFKAHSIRSATTSNAYAKGIPISEILHNADWTNEHTFRKYYLRECNP